MKATPFRDLPSVLGLAILLACGEPAANTEESVGHRSTPIIGGKPSGASDDAVVLIAHPDGPGSFGWCTGTMVAPNLVLTARHCVSTISGGESHCDQAGIGSGGGSIGANHNPKDLRIYVGPQRPSLETDIPASALAKTLVVDGATHICNHDVALIILDRSLAVPTARIRISPGARIGETVTAVGWGRTPTEGPPKVRQRRDGVAIGNVGPARDTATGIDVPEREFLVGEATCDGDSGSPAFHPGTGAIGIASRGDNGGVFNPAKPADSCIEGRNIYSMPSAFADLISSAFEQAGQKPSYLYFENGEPVTAPEEPGGCSMAGGEAAGAGTSWWLAGAVAWRRRRLRTRASR